MGWKIIQFFVDLLYGFIALERFHAHKLKIYPGQFWTLSLHISILGFTIYKEKIEEKNEGLFSLDVCQTIYHEGQTLKVSALTFYFEIAIYAMKKSCGHNSPSPKNNSVTWIHVDDRFIGVPLISIQAASDLL